MVGVPWGSPGGDGLDGIFQIRRSARLMSRSWRNRGEIFGVETQGKPVCFARRKKKPSPPFFLGGGEGVFF